MAPVKPLAISIITLLISHYNQISANWFAAICRRIYFESFPPLYAKAILASKAIFIVKDRAASICKAVAQIVLIIQKAIPNSRK